jgi:hypothetical protein
MQQLCCEVCLVTWDYDPDDVTDLDVFYCPQCDSDDTPYILEEGEDGDWA